MHRLVRTIEIISYLNSGKTLQYLYSITKEYTDNDNIVLRKKITRQEVEDHLNTGNWIKYEADRHDSEGTARLAIQIIEHYLIILPYESKPEGYVNMGEPEFGGIKKK